jgi:hypothetical protein
MRTSLWTSLVMAAVGSALGNAVENPSSSGPAGVSAPGVFIATSRYIPAAPDSVGLCSFVAGDSRYTCNTSWAYHPVPVTGALAASPKSGCLYVAAVANLGYPGVSAVRALPLGAGAPPCHGALPGIMPGAVTQLRLWNGGVLVADGTINRQGGAGAGARVGAGKLFWSPPPQLSGPAAGPVTKLDYASLSAAANTSQNCTLSNRGVVLGNTYVDACFCAGGGGGSVRVNLASKDAPQVRPLVSGFLMNTLAADSATGELLTDRSTYDPTSGGMAIDIVAVKLDQLGSKGASPRVVVTSLNQACGTTGAPGRGYPGGVLEGIEFDDATRFLYAAFSFELHGKPFDRVHRVYAYQLPPGRGGATGQPPPPPPRCVLLNSFQGDSGAGIGASYPTTMSVWNH